MNHRLWLHGCQCADSQWVMGPGLRRDDSTYSAATTSATARTVTGIALCRDWPVIGS